jgi:hypothetical protein
MFRGMAGFAGQKQEKPIAWALMSRTTFAELPPYVLMPREGEICYLLPNASRRPEFDPNTTFLFSGALSSLQ